MSPNLPTLTASLEIVNVFILFGLVYGIARNKKFRYLCTCILFFVHIAEFYLFILFELNYQSVQRPYPNTFHVVLHIE